MSAIYIEVPFSILYNWENLHSQVTDIRNNSSFTFRPAPSFSHRAGIDRAMTEFIVSQHLHAHPLQWNKKREFYNCEACKEVGHGPSYDCNHCKLKFHGDCAIAPATLRHPFFPTSYLHHVTSAAAGCSNQPKKCTACGSTIQGTAHGSKTMGVYFHPCCAMMPDWVQELNMVLIREIRNDLSTEVCGICNRAFDGQWVYRFLATGRHAHARCVMYEQSHAMNLVDSNLPFDNPDPVNSNMDGQMRSLNMAMDNMDPPTFTPHPQGLQESQRRSVPPSECSQNYSARWVPMPYPPGPQTYGVPYVHGHEHGHGPPNWNSSAPHAVQPGPGFSWPAPQNYWAQAPPGTSTRCETPMPPPPWNVACTSSTWGPQNYGVPYLHGHGHGHGHGGPQYWNSSAPHAGQPGLGFTWPLAPQNYSAQAPPPWRSATPYAWPTPAHLPYYPHAGAGWNSTTQVPPGGQAPSGPTVGGQAPPPNNAAGNSIGGAVTRWGFKIAMLAIGIADLVTD